MKTLFVVLLFSLGTVCTACTAFLIDNGDRHIVGKNYDWNVENGRVLANKKGVAKTAFGVQNPVSWDSKYGSVTFNQYGQEFPIGGINERGLVIEALWLDETAFPPSVPELPEIDNMQWIQFQLDVSADVNEVVKNSRSVQIRPVSAAAVHYFIADRSGQSLIVEAVGGVLHHYLPDSVNPAVVTNDPYDRSVRLLRKCIAFGGTLEIPRGQGSVSRFIRAAVKVKNENKARGDAVAASFRILNDVKMRSLTKWTITYDLDSLIVRFRSHSASGIKSIRLDRLNFNCREPVLFVNIGLNGKGDITDRFSDFGATENHDLLQKSVSKTRFLKHSGKQLIELLTEYPKTLTCSGK